MDPFALVGTTGEYVDVNVIGDEQEEEEAVGFGFADSGPSVSPSVVRVGPESNKKASLSSFKSLVKDAVAYERISKKGGLMTHSASNAAGNEVWWS